MYGPEYLDWRAKQAAERMIDAFLAGMEPEDRKWVLAVLRDRFEVRVEYKGSFLPALAQNPNQLSGLQLQQHLANQRPSEGFIGSLGSAGLRLLGR